MIASDGHKVVQTARGEMRVLSCTRWSELAEALQFHAGISHAAAAPTEFRMLNGSAPITVGLNGDELALSRFQNLLDGTPNGR